MILEMICRSKIKSKNHYLEHRDMHNLAKGFYSNTTSLSLRHLHTDAAEGSAGSNELKAMLVMESVATRRK